MKIDNLINEVKTTTKDLIVITNKDTIDSFFEDISNEVVVSSFGVFDKPEGSKKAKSVYRGGVTIHFIDEEDIDEDIFASSIANVSERVWAVDEIISVLETGEDADEHARWFDKHGQNA